MQNPYANPKPDSNVHCNPFISTLILALPNPTPTYTLPAPMHTLLAPVNTLLAPTYALLALT